MGKLLDAVRAKNGGQLSPDQERFVAGIEEAFMSHINSVEQNVSEMESRNERAMNEAITRVIGNLPKSENGEDMTVVEQLRSMAEKMDKIESSSVRKLTKEEKYNLRKMLEDKKQDIINATRSSSPQSVEIAFNAMRAAAMMTTQNVVTGVDVSTGTPFEWDNEIAYIRYPKNFVLDIIRNRQVTRVPQNRVKREQDSMEGNAALTAEGDVKPLVSYKFKDAIYPREKYAAHMEWTEEFEMDFEELFNAIIDLFERDVLRVWQDGLLQKIIDTAPVYTSTSLDGTIISPDNYAAFGAGILSIQNLEFEPTDIWMNQADVWAMNLTQNTDGSYRIPPFMVGSEYIGSLRLRVSNKIAAGKVLIGDRNTWKEEHTGFITRIGLINDQLIRNEKTIVGEVFSLMYQAESEKGSWIYLDLKTVKEALQKPATEPTEPGA